MTNVEELILQNQTRIMLALAMLLSGGDAQNKELARLTMEGAEFTRTQVAEWKRVSPRTGD